MRALIVLVSLCVVLKMTTPIAGAQSSDPAIQASLERVKEAASIIQYVYCDPDRARVFRGGLDSINAMAERRNTAPLHMQTQDIDGFVRAYAEVLRDNADYSSLENAAITGMVQSFDGSNSFKASSAVQRPNDGTVLLTLDGSVPSPVVIRVVPDGPAARAGILPGDRLIAIDGQSTTEQRLYEVVRHLGGAVGSSVTLTVMRDGSELSLSMTRAKANYAPVSWRLADGAGVITVESFPENSARDVRNAIRAIRREVQHPIGYVLDLRDNTGGLLDQVIDTVDMFVDGGPVLVVRPVGRCSRDLQQYNARRGDETEGARILVLVNSNTAAGAEIAAASLRESRRAMLVGQPTFGNAKMHTVIPMNGGRDGLLRLRTGTLSTRTGTTFDGTGLTPDVVAEARNAQADPAMEQALSLLRASPSP